MKKIWNRNRILSLFARLILGGVFVYASFDKVIHPEAFAEVVYRYQILPDTLINLTAIVLPWMELVLGGFLIFGFWMPGAVLMSNIILWAFTGALVFNMARGLDIGCGCFSTADENTMDIWTVLRDISFLIPAVYLLYDHFFYKTASC